MSQGARLHAMDRYAPLSGILAVVVFAAAVAFESNGPSPSDSPVQVAAKFASDQAGVLIGSYLLIVGLGLFAIFLSVLRSALRIAEGEPGTFSALTFGAGMAGLAVTGGYVAIYGSLAHGIASAGGANLAFAMFAASNSIDSVSGIFIALAVLAAAAVILRTAVFPRWLGWLAAVSGVLGAFGPFALERPDQPVGFVGFVGSLLFLAWMLAASVVLLRRGW
jgi:hypothetical protein